MNNKWMIIAVVTIITIIGIVIVNSFMSNIETPKYRVIKLDEDIEVRQYNPMIIAEVTINGQREDALTSAFHLLADYIGGNNIIHKDFTIKPKSHQQKNTKIAMTAPVQQQYDGNNWQISFIMPSEYTIHTLPLPINSQVIIKEVPAKQFVVVKFSGTNSDKNLEKYTEKLIQYIDVNNLSFYNLPKYAFYNPPWTLPPMRRNEIMIEIEPI